MIYGNFRLESLYSDSKHIINLFMTCLMMSQLKGFKWMPYTYPCSISRKASAKVCPRSSGTSETQITTHNGILFMSQSRCLQKYACRHGSHYTQFTVRSWGVQTRGDISPPFLASREEKNQNIVSNTCNKHQRQNTMTMGKSWCWVNGQTYLMLITTQVSSRWTRWITPVATAHIYGPCILRHNLLDVVYQAPSPLTIDCNVFPEHSSYHTYQFQHHMSIPTTQNLRAGQGKQ